MALALGCALVFYNLVLVERKGKLLFSEGPFLVEQPLGWWEKAVFLLFFSAEILLLLLSFVALFRWVTRALLGKYSWANKASVVLVGTSYFSVVTAQYGVLQYFRDGLDLALVRGLGGGDPKAALFYVQNEFAGLLPPIALSLGVTLAGGWLLRKYSHLVRDWLNGLWLTRMLSCRKGLLMANGAMVLSPLVLLIISAPVHHALLSSIAHRLYMAPATYLTDFDGDGYGFMNRPSDFAPFDSSRHPYAIEIPGNGIDENGVGGDLPAAVWRREARVWNPAELRRKNVLLVVMDSARYDLLEAHLDGVPVMPTLRSLPGEPISMFSHAGYTVPSVTAMLNGSLAEDEEGMSLIDRFKTLGYRTGVFSGQHEGFGDIATRTHMDHADSFFDARSFPLERRMYSNTSPSTLSIPAPLVNAKFEEWLRGSGQSSPFFAYLNWQEMHFPYYYDGAPTPLVDRPIRRDEIVPANRQWLLKTYFNAARNLDQALARVVALLDQVGILKETVILVVGDHGEELFENGYLGHGVNVSYEQNATLCKLINSEWKPPGMPVGVSEMGTVIHNALARSEPDALPLGGRALCYMANPVRPNQVGLVTAEGIVKYDFTKNLWTRQSRPGAGFTRAEADVHIIHLWESYVLQRLAAAPGTEK